MCGEDYKTVRNAVAHVVVEGRVDGLEEACEVRLVGNKLQFACSRSSLVFVLLVVVGLWTTVDGGKPSVGTVQRIHHSVQGNQC